MSPPDPSRPAPHRPDGPVFKCLVICDHALSRFIAYRLPHPPRFTRWLGVFSRCGDHGYVWYALGALPVILRRPGSGRRFAYVAGGQAAAEVLTHLVKIRIRRLRPAHDEGDPNGFIRQPASHSFPSAHASMGVVGVATLGESYPRARGLLTALLSILTFTRVYLRVHYAADVLAGLTFGTALAALYLRLVRAPGTTGTGDR